MAVEVNGPLIGQVIPWAQAPDSARAHAVDLSGHTLAPGFVDAHVHLLFTARDTHAATRAAMRAATPAQLAFTAARNAAECLLGGVTTVRDCGDQDFLTLELRDAIAAGLLPGPRVLAAGPPVTVTGGHLSWCGRKADSPDEVRRAVRELCAAGVDLVKIMASGGNMTHGSNPRMPQFDEHELRLAVTEAHRLGRRVAAHSQSAEATRRSVAAGADTVEHCGWNLPDGSAELDPRTVDAMVEQGTWAVLTYSGSTRPMLPEYAGHPSAERAAALALSATGDLHGDYEWARTMRERGVRMALASDAGVRYTPFRAFTDSIRCGMVTLDIGAAEAIGLATRQAAEALGISHEVGSVEPGKRADLVVLDGLVDAATTGIGAVRQVWRAGTPVVDHGRLTLPGTG
ncbi:amidohydrolase family protein [Nonomuraea endophytica]|uniref:amidohydrolase family protein n=1 Tax=Nonomuraea endophytica TaxID=714136 RepID=UPI0037C73CEA